MRHEEEADIQAIEARRETPAGEGTGWSLRAERTARKEGQGDYLFNAVVQHNARQAILRGDIGLGRNEDLTTQDLRLSLAGAIVRIGKTNALTRPVTDSFALVSVGEAEGVGVYVNGQPSGATNRRGQVVIPDLSSYYENQVSIEDKDVPIEYLMPGVRINVSPPLRSGSCLNFPLQKYQAFTGTLALEGPDGRAPLAYAEIKLTAPAGLLTFWTGGEGEFYLDSQQAEFDLASQQGCGVSTEEAKAFLTPGTYPLSVKLEEGMFQSQLVIPSVSDSFADLGELILPIFQQTEPQGEPLPREESGK
jgi:outer membrane usher protein